MNFDPEEHSQRESDAYHIGRRAQELGITSKETLDKMVILYDETINFLCSTEPKQLNKQCVWLDEQAKCASALIAKRKEHYQSLTPGFIESKQMAEGLLKFMGQIGPVVDALLAVNFSLMKK